MLPAFLSFPCLIDVIHINVYVLCTYILILSTGRIHNCFHSSIREIAELISVLFCMYAVCVCICIPLVVVCRHAPRRRTIESGRTQGKLCMYVASARLLELECIESYVYDLIHECTYICSSVAYDSRFSYNRFLS